jgi:lysozyme
MTRGQNWRRIAVWTGLVVLVLALCAALAVRAIAQWRPAPETYTFQGVDVSEAQGPIEWADVRGAGAQFAYIRATGGTGHRDAAFAQNWDNAAAVGLRRGAMHLYSLCAPGETQADLFNTIVPVSPDDLPAAVELADTTDCPTPPSHDAVIADLAKFLARVEAHTGKPALVLVPKSIERRYGISAAIARPVWSASNFFKPDYAARPWRMWRANDMRRVEGIEGPVNWDVVAP